MNTQSEISTLLTERIAAGDFPSAVYLVGEMDEIVFLDALGNAVVEPQEIRATTDTIYDLASLTKVLVTGLICAKLVEDDAIRPNDPVADHFVEFRSDEKRAITIADLLAHRSGLRAWLPFYLLTKDRSEIPRIIGAEPLADPIGSRVVYSDLNFLLLTFLIEKVFGKTIDLVADELIFNPLGLSVTGFNPPAILKPRIAASEKGNVFEKNTCLESGFEFGDFRFRENVVWGEVHDGNCWFMNGISGHAGLFSTAVETFRIAQQFLPRRTVLLKPETCGLFTKNLTPNLNEARSFAFQLAATPDSTASAALAPDSFGHLGFTGTSLWIEPGTERVFILLTNRTHVHPLPFVIINSVRRRFHELAASALTA